MRTFTEVMDLWGGDTPLAQDLNAKPATVRKWRERGRIPAEHWAGLLSAAAKRGLPVDADLLVSLAGDSK